ncbi:hypothetical protein TNCT_137881 [Trichonephila clavata]|uniref:Uncharacterized protein n=1 Tax=Trichonephila clavata TaxID=2740835 RepID=A0A8X6L4N0_TRICU|nr:hypothetical protein TNCT_137881 [Trichonephila clavata]
MTENPNAPALLENIWCKLLLRSFSTLPVCGNPLPTFVGRTESFSPDPWTQNGTFCRAGGKEWAKEVGNGTCLGSHSIS